MNRFTPFWHVVVSIIRKDFQAELRSRELVGSMGLFALLSVVVFSFALELDKNARTEVISGVLWVAVIFSSIIGLNRSMAMERDQGNLDALLIALLLMGTLGFTTLGTLLSAMTVQTRAREAMLPIVMLPVVLPLLMAAVRASTGILNTAPQNDWLQWTTIVGVLDIIYLTMCFLLFEYVVEE